jgi:hypothetical protein
MFPVLQKVSMETFLVFVVTFARIFAKNGGKISRKYENKAVKLKTEQVGKQNRAYI